MLQIINSIRIKNTLYTRKLEYEYFTPPFLLHNNLCELTALEHKFKR